MKDPAANQPYRLSPELRRGRCWGCWLLAGILVMLATSVASLELQLTGIFCRLPRS